MSFMSSFFHVIRELVLALGVAVLIPLIAYYGTVIFHPQPEYTFERGAILWSEATSYEEKALKEAEIAKENAALAEYRAARLQFDKAYFFVCLAIAFIAIITGMFLPMVAIGSGFILGGFITLITGYISYWGALHTLIKLGSLVAALIFIMLISYQRFGAKAE